MNNLLDNPDDFYEQIKRYTASVATSITYGYRGPTTSSFWARVGTSISRGRNNTDPEVQGVYDVMDRVLTIPTPSLSITLLTCAVDGSHGTGSQSAG